MINILIKDIDVFCNGSWCFPYLIVVPLNTVVSFIILFRMYGIVTLICYVAMAALLLLQYVSNKKLAALSFENRSYID